MAEERPNRIRGHSDLLPRTRSPSFPRVTTSLCVKNHYRFDGVPTVYNEVGCPPLSLRTDVPTPGRTSGVEWTVRDVSTTTVTVHVPFTLGTSSPAPEVEVGRLAGVVTCALWGGLSLDRETLFR